MQRSRVDFPHPDGPMIALTFRSGKETEMSLIAALPAKNAESECVATQSA
jgi:hypothetical protein